MTFPFGGRHNDQEATHDRARSLISTELLQPLAGEDATWLAEHLETCPDCRRDRDGFRADHDLLRSLRDTTPQPPRDLWARTAAAIDREAGARPRAAAGVAPDASRRGFGRGMPLGAAAGVLVLLVVIGVAYRQPIPSISPPASPDTALVSASPALPPPQPTPLAVAAGDVGWVRPAANGRWELVISKVDEVCPRARQGCEPLGENTPSQTVDLGRDPTGMTLSPQQDQLVVQSQGDAGQAGKVYVVPLATNAPIGSDAPPSEPPATVTPPVTEPPATPSSSPVVLPSETPGSTPSNAIEIASGVTMVGEAAYSADGKWLAFSARPADGSTGPDLYLWRVGEPEATQATTDHATYFSAWLDNTVLASRVETIVEGPVGDPGASGEPAAPEATTTAGASISPATSPASTPDASVTPAEFHPTSFLLDPVSGTVTDLTQPDVWLPVVDPGRGVAAYWSGTLVPTPDGFDWQLGEGSLVLDRWVEPGAGPLPSEPAAASSDPSTEPAADPSSEPSAAPLEVVGPAGDPVVLDVGELGVFKALFDTEGTRLAIWAADDPGADVGRLHLVVLDPRAGTVDPDARPLAGEPSLRRFSIDKGRLAWVSPRGQDGQESAVQVLGWQGRNFGEIQTIPAKDLFIVR